MSERTEVMTMENPSLPAPDMPVLDHAGPRAGEIRHGGFIATEYVLLATMGKLSRMVTGYQITDAQKHILETAKMLHVFHGDVVMEQVTTASTTLVEDCGYQPSDDPRVSWRMAVLTCMEATITLIQNFLPDLHPALKDLDDLYEGIVKYDPTLGELKADPTEGASDTPEPPTTPTEDKDTNDA